MKARIVGTLLLGCAVGASAFSSIKPQAHAMQANRGGTAFLRAAGSRSPQQSRDAHGRKFDASLADLSRHVRSGNSLRDLRALNSAAKFAVPRAGTQPLVLIDAVTRGDPQQLLQSLTALGLQRAAVYSNDVSGWLPVANLDAAAARGEVHSMRASLSRARATGVLSQGDFVQHSRAVRTTNALDGTGITVAVMSDSFDCYSYYAAHGDPNYSYNGFTATAADDMASGDLPAASSIQIVKEATCAYNFLTELPQADEGRATMQILHDVAPGAALMFNTADNGEADFAADIGHLADLGANIIVDDIGYFDEPFFQDGLIAQAIDAVKARGVAYFSAAGNNGNLAYDNTAPTFVTSPGGVPNPSGETLLNFDISNNTTATSIPITVPALAPGEFIVLALQWDQPYVTGAPASPGASSQLDLCVSGVTGTDVSILDDNSQTPATCTGTNMMGADPNQVMIIGNPVSSTTSSAAISVSITVGLAAGSAPNRIKLAVEGDGVQGLSIDAFANQGATVQGHPNALGASAIGAVHYYDSPDCGATAYSLAYYSSIGGTPTLFDATGLAITPVVRQKPDFVGPDAINNTFLGHLLAQDGVVINPATAACQTDGSLPNFFGTSAATPHVAGIAALLLQAQPALTPDALYQTLRASAVPLTPNVAPTFAYGYGFVLADAAYLSITPALPAQPQLSLSAAAVYLGQPATLSWSSANNQGCTAAGGWTGAKASAGSQIITPTVTGSITFSLVCTNAAGASASGSATLTVNGPPAAPSLSVNVPSITLGQSAMLQWSSSIAQSCTASGDWSGARATSGSATVVPTLVGSQTYTLICSNAAGNSPPTTATLLVTAAASAPTVPAAPTIAVAPASVTVGQTTVVTWSSVNADACAATGGWTGAKASSGSETITATAVGSDVFTLICSNSAGNSPASGATLTVAAAVTPTTPTTPAATAGGGGGGSLSDWAVAALAALALASARQRLQKLSLRNSPRR